MNSRSPIKSRGIFPTFSPATICDGLVRCSCRRQDRRSPKDSEHTITKKTKDLSYRLYSLRFLGFLLFIISVPSASCAVRSSVANPLSFPKRNSLGKASVGFEIAFHQLQS